MVVVNLEIVPFQHWFNTCLLPRECSRICASLGIFQVTEATFRLCFFFFYILLIQSFSQTSLKAETLLKLPVSRSEVAISCLRIFKSSRTLFVTVYPLFLLVNSSSQTFFLFWKFPLISVPGSLFVHEIPESLEELGIGAKESECPHN